ncbi:AAA family ATPase [Erwinia amylovora]|uniref:AAA family ATPase n=3 Tax=Erwinia amylovora TaxID=552 RepID=UPI001443DC42|nr:AAA family ATPase [Erwinia amylovora]
MITGLFLRNFKNYENINFIPYITSKKDRLTIFSGDNGAGKSALLESMNCLMNNIENKEWAFTIGQKKDRVSIFPLFIIEKNEWKDEVQQIERISHYFWNYNFQEVSNHESTKKFILYRDKLKSWYPEDTHYLIAIGKDYDGNILLTTTFHKKISDATKKDGVSKEKINNIFKKIIDRYKFIYLPVENKISDILSLQANEMQGMMDKTIADEIKALLASKDHSFSESNDANETSTRKVKHSVIDIINSKLDSYINGINEKIPEGYRFEYRGALKRQIKAVDILDSIFVKFFSLRPLSKNAKNIKNLSSGEQRLALIDIATSLLATDKKTNKEVILAIDEPEISLEAAHRFEQFLSLINLSEKFKRQIFITTHWYGLVLRPIEGSLNYVYKKDTSDNVQIDSFPLSNINEQRRAFPNSIEIRSYFDLMASMLTLLKKKAYNWLFCEGSEDYKYLKSYLKDSIPDLFILPFNGCGNIKKIYDFLHVPFSDTQENKEIKGKVMCLIDTDTKNLIKIEGYSAGKYNGKLAFSRLLMHDNESKLTTIASTDATNTEIEDVLDPDLFFKCLTKLSDTNPELKGYLSHYELDPSSKFVGLSEGLKFLKRKTIKAHEVSKDFQEYLGKEEIKKSIADEYTKDETKIVIRAEDIWIKHIQDFFTK